jgi:hypothetical protein
MAVLSLCLELSEHRGDDGEARCPVTYETVRKDDLSNAIAVADGVANLSEFLFSTEPSYR